jgi:hypothetical protein
MNFLIIVLGFITIFLTAFALCVAIFRKIEQSRVNLRVWRAMEKRQQELAEAEAHSAWLGNKEMLMY